jgi:hypothetical protein
MKQPEDFCLETFFKEFLIGNVAKTLIFDASGILADLRFQEILRINPLKISPILFPHTFRSLTKLRNFR